MLFATLVSQKCSFVREGACFGRRMGFRAISYDDTPTKCQTLTTKPRALVFRRDLHDLAVRQGTRRRMARRYRLKSENFLHGSGAIDFASVEPLFAQLTMVRHLQAPVRNMASHGGHRRHQKATTELTRESDRRTKEPPGVPGGSM